MSSGGDREQCPACGGAGGGPFGRAGSAWDVETYECPRCEGTGRIAVSVTRADATLTSAGLAKTTADLARRPDTSKDAKRGPMKAPSTSPAAPMTQGAKKAGAPKARG